MNLQSFHVTFLKEILRFFFLHFVYIFFFFFQFLSVDLQLRRSSINESGINKKVYFILILFRHISLKLHKNKIMNFEYFLLIHFTFIVLLVITNDFYFLFFLFSHSAGEVAIWNTNGPTADVFVKRPALLSGAADFLTKSNVSYTIVVEDMQHEIETENPTKSEHEELQYRKGKNL